MITNYRIEKIGNAFVVHVTSGKDGPVIKWAFLDKAALLEWLDAELGDIEQRPKGKQSGTW
jgi:hypothetical protein